MNTDGSGIEILDIVLTVAVGVWLSFMVIYPRRWDDVVDLELRFWRRVGLAKVLRTEWTSRFEKGIGFKILIGLLFASLLVNTVLTLTK